MANQALRLKRNAKTQFAQSLNHAKAAFEELMAKSGQEGFASALIKDEGFNKALHKAQLKFNDMVDDYLIQDPTKNPNSPYYDDANDVNCNGIQKNRNFLFIELLSEFPTEETLDCDIIRYFTRYHAAEVVNRRNHIWIKLNKQMNLNDLANLAFDIELAEDLVDNTLKLWIA